MSWKMVKVIQARDSGVPYIGAARMRRTDEISKNLGVK